MRLEEFLRAALPPEDGRTKLSPVKALLVLLRNLVLSREPLYGLGEWAPRHAADALGLAPEEIVRLNDDGVGRALDRLFAAEVGRRSRNASTRTIAADPARRRVT